MNYIEELGKKAKVASRELLKIGTKTKNDVLFAIADELVAKKEEIKAANKIDLENGKKKKNRNPPAAAARDATATAWKKRKARRRKALPSRCSAAAARSATRWKRQPRKRSPSSVWTPRLST